MCRYCKKVIYLCEQRRRKKEERRKKKEKRRKKKKEEERKKKKEDTQDFSCPMGFCGECYWVNHFSNFTYNVVALPGIASMGQEIRKFSSIIAPTIGQNCLIGFILAMWQTPSDRRWVFSLSLGREGEGEGLDNELEETFLAIQIKGSRLKFVSYVRNPL